MDRASVTCAPSGGRPRPQAVPPSSVGGRLRRVLLIVAGVMSVGLGVVGAFVPVLPTTPFLLLAAACFTRSSPRLHQWLLGNRILGEYLRRYRSGEGLPLASKLMTLLVLWAALATSAFVAVPTRLWWARILLLAVGVGVTIHILRIRTRRSAPRTPVGLSASSGSRGPE
jgi:uncharacterized membrane protein YbaN (DUF454 family)